MNVWPVIQRELRSQSRQRFTFALREIGVLVLLALATYLYVALTEISAEMLGAWMFSALHVTLFLAIWLLVPLGAADCLSRERREGTLGLLFLTPLRAGDVVTAKCLAHGLRASTLLLAVLPVLLVPMLIGGVSWQSALLSFGLDVAALAWALASAVLVSASSRSSLRALVWAVLVSFGAVLVFVYTSDWLFWTFLRSGVVRLNNAVPLGVSLAGIGGMRPVNLGARLMLNNVFTALGSVWLLAALVFLLAIRLAAWQVRRNWRDEPPARWRAWIQAWLCTPFIWRSLFQRWMRWLLDRNPIGWLERRTWTGRLVTWAWFAVIGSIYSVALNDPNFFRNAGGLQVTMAWLLMGSIAASVAGSFRRERESGVLELLLVAPLTTTQLIGGRLRGLWGQFLPAIALLLGLWGYFARMFGQWAEVPKLFYFAGTYLTLPVIGLYCSIRFRSYLGAFLGTLGFSLFVPRIFERLLVNLASNGVWLGAPYDWKLGYRPSAIVIQCFFALGFGWALYRRLERRNFPVERAVT